ncbi:hypothetical protein ACI789_07775 [Geodermatophilus sp. SYSU D00965]
MTGYVLRRSALSLGLLTALLAAAGALLVAWGARCGCRSCWRSSW